MQADLDSAISGAVFQENDNNLFFSKAFQPERNQKSFPKNNAESLLPQSPGQSHSAIPSLINSFDKHVLDPYCAKHWEGCLR